MIQLWQRTQRGWAAAAIRDPAACQLGEDRLAIGDAHDGGCLHAGTVPLRAMLRSRPEATGERWVLLSQPWYAVAINGRTVRSGIVALRDRDEIRLPDGTLLFFCAARREAMVEPFDGDVRTRCPRCRRLISSGSPVVRCPASGCGVVHHESEELPCWSYAPHCSVCPQPTDLDEPGWTPEAL